MFTFQFAALAFPELSPALFTIDLGFIGGPALPIRWYALSYIAGLIFAWRYAVALVRRPALFGGTSPTTESGIDDLIFYCMIGVMLGGRIGYVLFYQIPYQWDTVQADPWSLLRIWEGGMSFHGGFLGVVAAILYFAWSRKVSLLRIGDIAGVVTPLGIMFGRFANFTNAELYGKHTDSAFGMVFPEGRGNGGVPASYDWANSEWVYSGLELPRHASQLYEATLEGLLPFVVLTLLVWKFGALRRPGLVAGLFMIFYGVSRSISENFRLPDSFASDLPMGITMGMILSLPMWIMGGVFIFRAMTKPALTK